MDHTVEHEGIKYTFTLLTIGQEDEWRNWVRDTTIQEAVKSSEGWPMDLRAKFLAELSKDTPLDKCAFMGEVGQKKLASSEGVLKVLELASRKHHPNPTIPTETLRKVFEAKPADCGRIMLSVLPISDQVRTMMLGEFEKKVATGLMAGLA